ncbi:MAG: NTP transferase domain-containing protein [Gemmatimonadaceae bacterium]
MLLAAGRGTRLGSLTAETPKCLLQINGRTLLDYQLDALASAGVDDVTIVAGFMADAVVRRVANRCRVVINEQYATSNSITSLHLAAPHLRGNAFLLQNGDVLYQVGIIRRLLAALGDNACLVDSLRTYEPGEYHVEMADGRVVQYSNTLLPERSLGVSAQLLRVCAGDSVPFLDRIEELVSSGASGGFPNQAYDVLMRGHGLRPVFTAGLPWWEVDTADDLARCNADNSAAPTRHSGRTEPEPIPPPLGARIASFIRSPHMPWSLRWVSLTSRGLFRHPVIVARSVRAFRAGHLSYRALDLTANGPRFLRLVLSEARTLGFEPFLLWGTLLGCIRDGGFITGDHDIDLGVMATDADRLPELRDRMKRFGFGVRIENDDKLSLVHPEHPHLYIDIDVVRPQRDGWAITMRDVDLLRLFHYHFQAPVFADTKRAQFAHRLKVRVPADPDGFLAAVYGDWRVPASKVDYRYGPLNTEVELLAPAGVHAVGGAGSVSA